MAELKLPREAERRNESRSENIELLKEYPSPFWSMPWQSVLKHMKTSEDGLKQSEVSTRLLKHGKNEIFEDNRSGLFKIIISQLLSPSFYVLLIISLVSFLLAEVQTAAIILIMTLLFFVLRCAREYDSEQIFQKLKRNLAFSTRALREGRVSEIDTKELVPGDLIVLSSGDRVPADVRLIDTDKLRVDESALTGERQPVEKTSNLVARSNPIPQQMSNMAFAGSTVVDGRAVGVVVATGIETHFGKKALLHDDINDESKFQKELKTIGRRLTNVSLVVSLFVFAINVYFGHNLLTAFLFAATLAVILASEPLQSIATLFLSVGADKLSDNGVTVKRLSAMEDLGNVDTICCDKTGTLTEGRISVSDYLDVEGNRDDTPLLLGLQCSSVTSMKHHVSGNSIDVALMEHARRHQHLQLLSNRYSKVFEIPFDYERRRMSVIVKTKERNGKHILICKGAPEAILAVSANTAVKGKVADIGANRKRIMEKYIELSEKGHRVIAVAIKEVKRQESYTSKSEKDLTFVGFITFIDPPRRNAKDILELAKRNGISIKILTGDGPTVTRAIANKVGFDVSLEQVLVGSELNGIIQKNDIERLERTVIFAGVTPEQKFKIIRALRSRGRTIAFVGGDLNDVGPLTEADVSISVQDGSDAAKNGADIVLTRKNLNSIMDAVFASRNAFNNVVKYVRCMLAVDFGELCILTLSSAFINFILLLPAQILIAKFLTDFPLLRLSDDDSENQELMRPREYDANRITQNSTVLGMINAVFGLIVVAFMMNMNESLFQSVFFLELVFSGAFIVLSLRTIKPFVITKPGGILLFISVIFVSIVGAALVSPQFANALGFETPLVDLIVFAFGVAVAYVLTTEMAKYVMYRHLWTNEKKNLGEKKVMKATVESAMSRTF